MSEVWVQATEIVYLEKAGVVKTLLPGMWGTTTRGHARQLLNSGQARILNSGILKDVQELTDCTIFLRGTVLDSQRQQLESRHPGVPVLGWDGYPTTGRFLLWDTSVSLRQELIVVGFGLLKNWQLAVPLLDYNLLAENVGTKEEQQQVREVIHDLRVPLYNPKVIFCRQGQETRKLFELWDGTELGFLRALYQSRPVVNALPPSWIL